MQNTSKISVGIVFAILSVLVLQTMMPYVAAYPSVGTGPFTQPSAIAINNKTGIVYIAQNGTNSLSVMGGKDFFIFMMLPTGQQPIGMAVNNKTNLIYVANNGSNNITIVNGSTNSFSFMVAGTRPVGVAVNPSTNMTYVVNNGSSTVTVIPTKGKVPYTLSGPSFGFSKPVSVAVNSVTNRTYVGNIGDNSVTVIPKQGNPYKLLTGTYSFSKPVSIAVNSVTNRTYVANYYTNTVTIIKTDNTFSTLNVGTQPVSIAVNPQTNRTYIVNQGSNSITVIKGSVEPNVIYTILGFNKPASIAVNPTTNATYVVNTGNNTVTIIPGDANVGGFNPALPTAPTNLQTVAGNGQITLTWSPPSFNGTGAPLVSYTIQKSTNGGQSFSNLFTGSLANASKIITGLTNNQPLVFRVNATNGVGTGTASFPMFAMPSANPVGQFIAPPPPPSADMMAAMIANGLHQNFVMPSPLSMSSGTFNAFSVMKTVQNLTFTSQAPIIGNVNTLFSNYAIQSYSPPSNWNTSRVWAVPPQMAPLNGDPGMMGMFKLSQATKDKPFFLPFSNAKPLPNGAVLGGVQMALATNASNLQVASEFLSAPPQGLPSVPNALMYLNFSLQDNNGINFHDQTKFTSTPKVSFLVAPVSGSTSPTSPINTVNSALTCPNISVSFLDVGKIDPTGIVVSRDPTGDTSTKCGYTATIQHFSSYGVNSIADSTRGGSENGSQPPSFSTNQYSAGEYPLTLSGKGYMLSQYQNTIPTDVVATGQPLEIKLLPFSYSGASNIQHVAVYMNLRGTATEVFDSDTFIIYEKGSKLELNDPHGFFSNVGMSTQEKGNKLEVTFDITFTKPMEKSNIIFRTWTSDHASMDTKVIGAIEVTGNEIHNSTSANLTSLNPPSQSSSAPSVTPTEPSIPNTEKTSPVATSQPSTDLTEPIKEWSGYSQTSISDSQLLESMNLKGSHIPSWVMKTTKWVLSEEVSQDDFVGVVKYLSEKGIIK